MYSLWKINYLFIIVNIYINIAYFLHLINYLLLTLSNIFLITKNSILMLKYAIII